MIVGRGDTIIDEALGVSEGTKRALEVWSPYLLVVEAVGCSEPEEKPLRSRV